LNLERSIRAARMLRSLSAEAARDDVAVSCPGLGEGDAVPHGALVLMGSAIARIDRATSDLDHLPVDAPARRRMRSIAALTEGIRDAERAAQTLGTLAGFAGERCPPESVAQMKAIRAAWFVHGTGCRKRVIQEAWTLRLAKAMSALRPEHARLAGVALRMGTEGLVEGRRQARVVFSLPPAGRTATAMAVRRTLRPVRTASALLALAGTLVAQTGARAAPAKVPALRDCVSHLEMLRTGVELVRRWVVDLCRRRTLALCSILERAAHALSGEESALRFDAAMDAGEDPFPPRDEDAPPSAGPSDWN
jgi:hypothetical protein